MEALVRIQAAATRLGVSHETLRRYERLGLIPPASRNRAGQRVYTHRDLESIRRIIVPADQSGAGD